MGEIIKRTPLYLVLFVALGLFSSCKKKKSEGLLVGTWHVTQSSDPYYLSEVSVDSYIDECGNNYSITTSIINEVWIKFDENGDGNWYFESFVHLSNVQSSSLHV